MTGMVLYAAFALMILTVLSNRYWRRQIAKSRNAADKVKEKVDEITKEVASVASHYASISHELSLTESRANRAEQELNAAIAELEEMKKAGTDRYYIFDRLEPRQGRFWEASIRFHEELVNERLHHRTWAGVRRWILVAENERDAKHRVQARFPRKSGFELIQILPCKIANLTVNRVNEFSTFRRGGANTDDDGGDDGRRGSFLSRE